MVCGDLDGPDPSTHHIAEGADLQKPSQAEGHGLSIKPSSVVEQHIPAQRDGHRQPIGADDR